MRQRKIRKRNAQEVFNQQQQQLQEQRRQTNPTWITQTTKTLRCIDCILLSDPKDRNETICLSLIPEEKASLRHKTLLVSDTSSATSFPLNHILYHGQHTARLGQN